MDGKYKKQTPRLNVKYIDAETEEILFELNDRTWANVGELLSDYHVDSLVKSELKRRNIELPDNVMVLVVGEYELS